ncbi:MAG: hypothetical protein EAX89_01270 [Candidatus Lokiarchaeota archaeon]|nr:hypothetical protein [Candidatus Lokiarchaeota archaeon]
MFEEDNKFLEFLNYQIHQKNKFDNIIRKIPMFKSMIQERHKTVLKMISKFEDVRRREVYHMLLNEFGNIMDKK